MRFRSAPAVDPFYNQRTEPRCVTASLWELDSHYFRSCSHPAGQFLVPEAQRGAIMGLWSPAGQWQSWLNPGQPELGQVLGGFSPESSPREHN